MTAATPAELEFIERVSGSFAAAQYAASLDVEQHSLLDYERDDPFSGVAR